MEEGPRLLGNLEGMKPDRAGQDLIGKKVKVGHKVILLLRTVRGTPPASLPVIMACFVFAPGSFAGVTLPTAPEPKSTKPARETSELSW